MKSKEKADSTNRSSDTSTTLNESVAAMDRISFERDKQSQSKRASLLSRKQSSKTLLPSDPRDIANFSAKPNVMPLAHPKGQSANCEVCGSPAYYSCTVCRTCFYCTLDHKRLDMELMHPSVCHIIAAIKGPVDHATSQMERERIKAERRTKTKEIVDIAFEKSRHSLQKRRVQAALLQVTYSLRFAQNLYKKDDVAMIPFFLVIAEVYGLMGKLDQSLQYMAKTEHIMLENNYCPSIIKADFHKTHGILNVYSNEFDDALDSFSNEIYYATLAYHTEHRRTAAGYFNLATVFLTLNKTTISHSLFMHTVRILRDTLYEDFQYIVGQETQGGVLAMATKEHNGSKRGQLTVEEINDIWRQLNFVYSVISERISSLTESNSKLSFDFANVCYTVSLLFSVTGEYRQGMEFVQKASDAFKLDSLGDNNKVAPSQELPTSAMVEKLKYVKKYLKRHLAKLIKESVS